MISDNKKGNPNHDEEGKFTSGSNSGKSGSSEYEDKLKKALGMNVEQPKKETPNEKYDRLKDEFENTDFNDEKAFDKLYRESVPIPYSVVFTEEYGGDDYHDGDLLEIELDIDDKDIAEYLESSFGDLSEKEKEFIERTVCIPQHMASWLGLKDTGDFNSDDIFLDIVKENHKDEFYEKINSYYDE